MRLIRFMTINPPAGIVWINPEEVAWIQPAPDAQATETQIQGKNPDSYWRVKINHNQVAAILMGHVEPEGEHNV
jgi:hypothetical protein